MAMMNYEKSKFRFSETFNNESGKTSGSGFVGVLLGLLTGVGFIAGTIALYLSIDNVMEYFEKVIQLGGLSALLMGVRKVTRALSTKKTPEPEPPKEEL